MVSIGRGLCMLIRMPAFPRARTAAGVVVVGSANADFATQVERRPQAGETVMAVASDQHAGGKGANQAAAAARAGAAVWFVGAVGDDELGRAQLDALRQVSVDVSQVLVTSAAPTGAAFITVTPDGENTIVVALGANALLHPGEVLDRLTAIPTPAVVLIQTEIPVPTIDAVAGWCAANGVRLVLNNGPYRHLAAATLRVADPLVLNEHEARELCADATLPASALAEASRRVSGARSVLVTLGSAGVQLCTADASTHVPGVPVTQVVDTTGAGDTFVGTLAALLAAGADLEHAAEGATAAAAESVTWPGARPA